MNTNRDRNQENQSYRSYTDRLKTKTAHSIRATGAKAFMLGVDLTNVLLTTKDSRAKVLLEGGYKRAQQIWASNRPRRAPRDARRDSRPNFRRATGFDRKGADHAP